MKTVLITGANKGIGFAAAKKFSAAGYKVIIAGRDAGRLNAAYERLGKPSGGTLVWDIAEIGQAVARLEEAHERFGEIDTAVNNAGIVTDLDMSGCRMLGESEESWDETMLINLKGTYFAMQAEARYMISRGIRGHIVVVDSLMGFAAKADAYSVSKWGVRGMIYGAAKELAPHGICVNGVAPGETATEILRQKEGEPVKIRSPRGCRAMPGEIADDILYLASSDNLIGTIIQSDGGASLL